MVGRRIAVPLIVVVAALTAGGVAGALLGVPGRSGAATTTTPSSSSNQPNGHRGPRTGAGDIEAAAKALNLTTDELLQKLSDGKTTIADIAAQEHIDLDKVIDAIASADRQRIEDFVKNPLKHGHGAGPGMGALGKGGLGGLGFARPAAVGAGVEAAAKALGMTVPDLITELRGGKSIADVAQDKNVKIDKVIDAMVAAGEARIDKAKDAGKIDADQADKLKSKLRDAVTKGVDAKFGAGKGKGFGFGGRGGGHFGPRPGGPSGPSGPNSSPESPTG